MRVFDSRVLSFLAAVALLLPAAAVAQDKPPKIAILRIQEAIARCNDGQKAAGQLRERFAPKQQDLEKEQREITDLQNQLKTQEKTLSDDARGKLMRSIDDKTRVLNRANEDAQAEAQQAEQDAINEIGRKMMTVIIQDAKANGFSLVLDVSSPQTPVLYADQGLDITDKIIELYNASSASLSGAAPSSQPKSAAPAAKAPDTKPATPAKP